MINKIYDKLKAFILENFKFLIFLIVMSLLFLVELPFVVYAPGGAIDLSDRIEVENGYESDGKLQMAYVSLIKGSTPFVLLAKILPNWDITKKSDIMYENEDTKDLIARDRVYLQQSIDNAIIEAYRLTEKKLEITNRINHIVYIAKEAETNLKIGDILLEVNSEKNIDLDHYKEIVTSLNVGDEIELLVKRNNKNKKCTIKVFDTEDGLKTGISLATTFEYTTDPKINIKSKNSESGPSGGLMLSLGIYNSLIKEDITKGRNIIGTGTIEEGGVVGEIGGVKYKLIGAVKNKADVFICPMNNYKEAMKVKEKNNYNIKIIGVETLDEAIQELSK